MKLFLLLLLIQTQYFVSAFDFKYISNYISKNQYPRHQESCKEKRLLILHYSEYEFEGTGSILKWIMIGLAEALHSNRTLIWGRYIPNFFTRGVHNNCYNATQGGLYDCLFQRLSTCSIADIHDNELKRLGTRGFDDSARVSLSQPYRGLALYMAPQQFRHLRGMSLIWPTAVAAFVFRPIHTLRDFPLPSSSIEEGAHPALSRVVYCAHIRHGDIAALEEEYPNRQVYPHIDYYSALRRMSTRASPGRGPDIIYLATDDIAASSIIRDWEIRWRNDTDAGTPEDTCGADAQGKSFCESNGGASPVPVFSVRHDIRRSEFGTHYFAAQGGCTRDETHLRQYCKLSGVKLAQIFKETEGHNEHEEVSRVAQEAVEDIHLLSQCSGIVGTASSHFTTVSMLLAWARVLSKHAVGVEGHVQSIPAVPVPPDMYVFLDEDGVVSGRLESSYLIGKHDSAHLKGRASERWAE